LRKPDPNPLLHHDCFGTLSDSVDRLPGLHAIDRRSAIGPCWIRDCWFAAGFAPQVTLVDGRLLVVQLKRLIKDRKLTQIAAAKLVGIKQPDLSNILRGQYRGYSVERLMRMLTAFDQDVEISSSRAARRRRPAGSSSILT
jgi:predicted XRE-type DNA-binding protein